MSGYGYHTDYWPLGPCTLLMASLINKHGHHCLASRSLTVQSRRQAQQQTHGFANLVSNCTKGHITRLPVNLLATSDLELCHLASYQDSGCHLARNILTQF